MFNTLKKHYILLKLNHRKHNLLKNENLSSDGYFEIYPETSISGKLGNIKVGDMVFIRGKLEIQRCGGTISIGNKVYIGDNTRIWSANKISIGNNVMIAHNCNIFDNDTHPVNHLERRDDFNNILMSGG